MMGFDPVFFIRTIKVKIGSNVMDKNMKKYIKKFSIDKSDTCKDRGHYQ